MPNISDLHDEEDNEVDIDNDGVQSEGCEEVSVNAPDGMAVHFDIIMGMVETIIDTGNDNQQPGDNRQELVCPDDMRGMAFALCEGVCCDELVRFDQEILAFTYRIQPFG